MITDKVIIVFCMILCMIVGSVVQKCTDPDTVCTPLHVNLNDSLYRIISIDTVYSSPLNYKVITYSVRK